MNGSSKKIDLKKEEIELDWKTPFPCEEHNGAHMIRRAVGKIGRAHISVSEEPHIKDAPYQVLIQDGSGNLDGLIPTGLRTQAEVKSYLITRLSGKDKSSGNKELP